MKNFTKAGQNKISDIPKDWDTAKLGERGIFEVVMGQSPPSLTYNKENHGLPFLQGKMEFGEIFPSPLIYCSKPIKIAEKNDILISVRAPVGDVNISPSKLCIGRGLASIRCNPQKILYLFLFYFMKYKGKKFENISSGSTFKAIRRNELDNFEILLPSPNEQKKIAEILSTVDQTIEKIDEAIEKDKRLKKGLMQKLLTKGIGHKEFKRTVYGKTPIEWKEVKLKDIAKVRYGMGQPPELKADGPPMIRATNIKRGKVIKEGLIRVNPDKIPSERNPYLKEGDIIVVRSGAYTGDIGFITKEWEGAIAGYDLVVSSSKHIDPHFLSYYLQSPTVQVRQFFRNKARSAQPHLNSSQVEETRVFLPPIIEQHKIAEILSNTDNKLESLKGRKSKLRRIKNGLMHDLLTGKVRVIKQERIGNQTEL